MLLKKKIGSRRRGGDKGGEAFSMSEVGDVAEKGSAVSCRGGGESIRQLGRKKIGRKHRLSNWGKRTVSAS